MANYLDANPDVADHIRAWKGQLVPFARDGELLALARDRMLQRVELPRPLTVLDYVVGLELLGFRFDLLKVEDDTFSLFRKEPDLSPAWDAHAVRIAEAFGRNRMNEVRAFLIKREGAR